MAYRIAYLTSKNPNDKNVSSGVYYYQTRSLKKYCGDVFLLGPIDNLFIKIITKSINFLERFTSKKYKNTHSILISRIYGKIFSKKIRKNNYDIIFADKASCEIAFIKTSVPLIYSTDATFKQMQDYYPEYSNLSKKYIMDGNIVERNAISKSLNVICASKWAALSVANDYSYPESKIHVIPRGANIDKIPDIEMVLNKQKSKICRLLFMGKEWERKGYDVAFQTLNYIRSSGTPVKLIVAGFLPPPHLINEDVEVIDYIDKNSESGLNQFSSIMLNSDFLFIPTRAECMGIAFCEASAFGLISITRNTGGVTEVVKDGINGYALDFNADFKDFGDTILKIYKSDHNYYNLVKSSRKYYDERLNWDHWGMEIKKILDGLFKK